MSKQPIKKMAQKILSAKSLILTTHTICDGDGLGALLGLYHALKKKKKKVRAVTVDPVPAKYSFLSPEKYTQSFDQLKTPLEAQDLALILDTNDSRRVEPLFGALKKLCREIIYIDHHPLLKKSAKISEHSLIDTSRASTGELGYLIIKELGVALNEDIAEALYTSILFDTQRFKFIRNSPASYTICAKLLPYIKDSENIYDCLFGKISHEKMNMFAQSLQDTKYFYQNQVAILELSQKTLLARGLNIEDACDFLDSLLEVTSTQLSLLIIHLSKNQYKLSFRSKKGDVCKLAEVFNGGGHKRAAGATLKNYKKNPREEILKILPRFIDLASATKPQD